MESPAKQIGIKYIEKKNTQIKYFIFFINKKVNITYKQNIEKKTLNLNELFKHSEDDVIEERVSNDELERLVAELEDINKTFQTNNTNWINLASENFIELTKRNEFLIKRTIVHSKTFQAFSSLHLSTSRLNFLRAILNLSSKSPLIVLELINLNAYAFVFDSLFNVHNSEFDDYIMDTSLKALNNLINSSCLARIWLVTTNFFNYATLFYSRPNKLRFIQYMSNLIRWLISCFHDPPHKNDLLDDPQTIENIFKLLNKNNFNYEIANKILNNGIILAMEEPFLGMWNIITILINHSDGESIKCGLKILRILATKQEFAIYIFENTHLYEKFKDFCSRNNTEITINLLYLLSKFAFILTYNAQKKFSDNDLYDYISSMFFSECKEIRIAAMKCISNYIPLNKDVLHEIFTPNFIEKLFNMITNISYNESEEIVWNLMNIGNSYPEMIISLFRSPQNMGVFLDFLNIGSASTIMMELNAFQKISHLCQASSDKTFLYLFKECDGLNIVENLISTHDEKVALAAQAFLKDFSFS